MKSKDKIKKKDYKNIENVKIVNIENIIQDSYMEYSMAVIIGRSIPDIIDGLKPSQRRVLWASRNYTEYKKSARIVGEVLGKYHPHSDSSCYSTMVRLAQPWKVKIPLMDGHGNFGSIDGDSPAAQRYTESRIHTNATSIYFAYNQSGIEYKLNYDGSLNEPMFLPTQFPMVLVNGTMGAAVGFSTDIPTHNPIEVINAYSAYIKDELTSSNIRKYLKGPDPIQKCEVLDFGGIDRGYATGRGSFYCRVPYTIEDGEYGKKQLVFESVLPDTIKSERIMLVADKAKTERSAIYNMLSDIRDESSRDGIRIVIVCKRGVDPEVVGQGLEQIGFSYKKYSITSTLIVNGRPMRLGIMRLFEEFHKLNYYISTNHLINTKKEKEDKLHILDGIAFAVANIDDIINIIQKSKLKEDVVLNLKKKYKNLSDVQIDAILDTKLNSLVGKGKDIKLKVDNLKSEIKVLNTSLKDVDKYILNILEELKTVFKGFSRRNCKVISQINKTRD